MWGIVVVIVWQSLRWLRLQSIEAATSDAALIVADVAQEMQTTSREAKTFVDVGRSVALGSLETQKTFRGSTRATVQNAKKFKKIPGLNH